MVNGRLVNRHPAYASGWASVPNSFFDFATMLGLTPYERLVWLHLFRRTQGSREVAFPSVPRLAGECGISVRSVQKAIKGLVLSGTIGRRERRDHRGAPTTPEYDVAPLLRRLDYMQKRRGVVSVVHHPGAPGAPEVDSTEEDKRSSTPYRGTARERTLPDDRGIYADPAYLRRVIAGVTE